MLDPLEEKVMEQEARIRVLEKSSDAIIGLLRWILATAIAAVIIPILIHKYGLA